MVKSRSKKFDVKDRRLSSSKPKKWTGSVQYDIDAANVKIMSAPSWGDLRNTIPDIVMSTWSSKYDEYTFDNDQKDALIYRAMNGHFLPQAVETINFVVAFDGISSHDITHIVRTRTNTYIVECTGDQYKADSDVNMPYAFDELGLGNKYRELEEKQMELYCEALNNGMHIQDARMILPRGLQQFVIARIPFNNIKSMISQRADLQIQPPVDNIIAYKLALEVSKTYMPFAVIAKELLEKNSWFYIAESGTNFASKHCMPLKGNENADIDYAVNDCTPMEMPGRKHLEYALSSIKLEIDKIAEQAQKEWPQIFSSENIEDYR